LGRAQDDRPGLKRFSGMMLEGRDYTNPYLSG